MDPDPTRAASALGLKEIGNLASWTVSSFKPGCGVAALRHEDTSLFWQSDGPQPHHLNIHFTRLVSIVSLQIFLDFEADESYTPTRISLLAGTGHHDLIPFQKLSFEQPRGWIHVALEDVGGGEDGQTLKAFLLQLQILENHQNGKDTHVRGVRIYARNEAVSHGIEELGHSAPQQQLRPPAPSSPGWPSESQWMEEHQLR
ncbi:Anaphase-promoting complex subunit 10 [Blumeria hordei DH14]|uniref:Anaphase-promoting complex subunit 10 n=1 Tax=Blumeria graminis f. sp. hordei (strain DH14) TaxID=546991 RepID=N1JD23_BLUG1|nr:Anaphase-promoting complex subunit 10 [Blumeria hordei DH14]